MTSFERKIADGLVYLLGQCGLEGEIRSEANQATNRSKEQQTIIEVDSELWADSIAGDNMYSATARIEYSADSKRFTDAEIEADVKTIRETLINRSLLKTNFNYATPYDELNDERPVQGVHYHGSTSLSVVEDHSNTLKLYTIESEMAVEEVIDHP